MISPFRSYFYFRGIRALFGRVFGVVWFSVALSVYSFGHDPVVRIMPLGDSITRGNNDINYPNGDIAGGYRKQLGLLLDGSGFPYDFVGARTDNAAPDMDPDHNGNPGWRTDEILAGTPGWLAEDPGIVLLMAGTNDILQEVPVSTAVANLNSLIQVITGSASGPKLYVSTIVPITQRWPPYSSTDNTAVLNANANAYNVEVRNLVAQHALQGKDVTLVDMNALLVYDDPSDPINDFYQPGDGIHPGQAGYDQLGMLWTDAITASGSLLPGASGSPDTPTSLSATVASPTRINISWVDNADDELVYQVLMKTGNEGEWEAIASLDADSSGFAASGLTTGVQPYGFMVRAGNGVGYSGYSNTAFSNDYEDRAYLKTAGASSSNAVDVPPNANNGDAGSIWAAAPDDSAARWQVDLGAAHQIQQVNVVPRQDIDVEEERKNFEIRASDDPSFTSYEVLAEQGSTAIPHQSTWTSPVDSPVPYRYLQVAKTDGQEFSIALVNVSGAVPAPVPAAPGNLTATALDSSHVSLTWDVQSSDETGFKLERKAGVGGSYIQIASPEATSSTFKDSGLDPETSYSYRLSAINESGESAFTNEASVVTGNNVPYDDWSAKYPDFIAMPSADQLPSADANGDGVSNLLAYALGLDPLLNAIGQLPVIETGSPSAPNELVFRFRRNKLAPDLDVRVRSSFDLSVDSWSDSSMAGATFTAIPGDPDSELVSLPVIPDSAEPRKFFRLRVKLD